MAETLHVRLSLPMRRSSGWMAASLWVALMTSAPSRELPSLPHASVVEREFSAIQGWYADDHLAAYKVFKTHCNALAEGKISLREGATPPAAFASVCAQVNAVSIVTNASARLFFETCFQPLEIVPESGPGFLTGYYEPETEGSFEKTDLFQAPLLSRPEDVVTIPQGQSLDGIPAGFAAARSLPNGQYAIYPDRQAILSAKPGTHGSPILWLRDAVEVFFMQVQGSGRVRLPNGQTVRIAYSGRNGHPYSSIGRIVVKEGLMPLEDATMDKLKAWLRAHPIDAQRIMAMNHSYVFFRLAAELADSSGPIGGAGLPLTPWRSIAVDRSIWAYGLPVWIDAALPNAGDAEPFRKLTIAQDTGSAILGPARADLYHGSGPLAGTQAGVLRHPMRFIVLWPKQRAAVPASSKPLP
jgi:membrane-bound lytic murein transglycosylase A